MGDYVININNAVQFQHLVWDRVMKHASVVVDATCGNGHDLLYLAKRAEKGCHLYGIDIQMTAINNSQELLQSNDIAKDISLTLIFNLGYLPGSDHHIITKPYQTIDAIKEGLKNLSKSGIITIISYPGTTEGLEEMQILKSFLSDLEQKLYNVCHWQPMNQINNPPELFILQKR